MEPNNRRLRIRLNRRWLLRSSMIIQAMLAFSMIVSFVFISWGYSTEIADLQKTQVIDLPMSTHGTAGNDGLVETNRSPIRNNDRLNHKNVSEITAWEIKPEEHVQHDFAAKVKPATVCGCAKCGTTSLYRELFAIVHGRSYDSINYKGPGFIHNLSNRKIWTNIRAKKKTDWSNFQNEDSLALIRDPKERLISAWRDKVSCRILKKNPTQRRFVPQLLKLAGSSNVTAKESKGYPCLDLSDYLSVLFQIHSQRKEGLLDSHFLPQTLGCFNNAPPSMWTHITTISDPNTLCLLKSIVLGNTNITHNIDSNCQKMMKANKTRKDLPDLNPTLDPTDEDILDKITVKEYEMLGKYLTKSLTSANPRGSLTALRSQSDICNLALHVELEHYSSYQLGLDWSNVDHVTKKLCLLSSSKESAENRTTILDSPTPVSDDAQLILIFKVARSGSTFFTDVIMKALNTMKRAANLHWEPYCRAACYNRKSTVEMEKELSIISSSNCSTSTNTIDDPSCSIPGTHKKCCPVKKCHSPEFQSNAVSVVSLNPRFSDSVRWGKILSPSFPQTSSAKVFNLRRTNLVNLAYSKYHHDGCPNGENGDECIPEKTNSTSFSFDCLLQCVQHYGIGDQEFSSSVAFEAVQFTKLREPHLLLYEDVMRDQIHASVQVFNFIGVEEVMEGNNFFNSTTEKKQSYRRSRSDQKSIHGDHICDYHDVNCTEWREKLKEYPCLLKQLNSKSTVAWSVPIQNNNGKLSLGKHGDCHRLENLDKVAHRDRLYEELYLRGLNEEKSNSSL